jgi:hypothetical protein
MSIESSPNERELLAEVVREVRLRVPEGWDVVSVLEPATRGPDALLTIRAPDGAAARFIVEAKANLDPRNALYALDQVRAYRDWLGTDEADPGPGFLLVAPFISQRAQDVIAEAGASYADATGNLRLRFDRPAMFIQSHGADVNPWRQDRERKTKTLRGVPAARVVRALSDWRPPVKASDLAARAGTSIGATYRVLDLLDREALIARRGKGEVLEVEWPGLLRRWSQDYDFVARNRTSTLIAARGLSDVLEQLRSTANLRYAVTGSIAAARYAPYAEARLGAIYVDDVEEAATQLGLRPTKTGANLVLAEPFDDVVYQRALLQDGIAYTAPSQTVVDLLTGPGRNPAEGEELIRWMEDNERAWRV